MNLISWSPFRELDDVFERFSRSGALPQHSLLGEKLDWRPAASITENDTEYLIKADLPEVKKEDIDIAIDSDVLTIRGERRVEKTSDEEKEHRRETFYGSFSRSFALPADVNQEAITADCKDGVLAVHLPKSKAQDKPQVSIKVK